MDRLNWLTARDDSTLAGAATHLFTSTYQTQPTGVWAAPGRVNLIGDHVDYALGVSIPCALAHSTAVAMSLRTDGLIRAVSASGNSGTPPLQDTVNLADVRESDEPGVAGHPSGWLGYVAGTLYELYSAQLVGNGQLGWDIAIVSDVPVGSGLSSSAALECSVGYGALELSGKLDDASGASDVFDQLVTCAIDAENEVVGASTGGLDQTASVFGQQDHALMIDFDEETFSPVPLETRSAELAFLVANTNSPHDLSDGQYASRRGIIDAVTTVLHMHGTTYREHTVDEIVTMIAADPLGSSLTSGGVVQQRIRHVVEETQRTLSAGEVLGAADVDWYRFGQLMTDSHVSLRDLYEVSTPELNTAQQAALEAGALGARLTGGGFGGSIVALVPTHSVATVAEHVAAAAATSGFPAPTFLTVTPSAGARRIA